jgi:hypothetical protein
MARVEAPRVSALVRLGGTLEALSSPESVATLAASSAESV